MLEPLIKKEELCFKNTLAIDDSLIDRLDLVERMLDSQSNTNFENMMIIGAQHILPSTLTMLKSFFDRGLRPKNVFLIGKCYSTDFDTYHKLIELGVYVCPSSFYFNKDFSFDIYYQTNIASFMEKILKAASLKDKKLIVALDDGGELITVLNQHPMAINLPIVCLEQTTSGFEKLSKIKLNFGVINLARSDAKINFESSIVAKTAIREIDNKILKNPNIPKNVLIIGNGAIGNAIANALEGKCNTSIVDKDPKKSINNYKKVFNAISEFDMIFGCVGANILPYNVLKNLKKGATLISVSSSDREFDIVKWRRLSPEINSCHNDFQYKGITVMNCGFPINFSGDASKVDIKEFELTRALLSLGIVQAFEHKTHKGFIPLNITAQYTLIDWFSKKYI